MRKHAESDVDIQRMAKKVRAYELTVAKLFENFINDLVCGTYSNGSDKWDFAE
jgi:hypothetical protein